MMGKQQNKNTTLEKHSNINFSKSPFKLRKLNKVKNELIYKWSIAIIMSTIKFQQTYPMRIVKKKNDLQCRIKGLRNLGNTCYMNSTLQCLLNLGQFNTRLLEQLQGKNMNAKITNDHNGQQSSLQHLSQQYMNLVNQFTMTQNQQKSLKHSNLPINPQRLKSIINKKMNKFYGYRQHDAQQFLTQFLLTINNEVSRIDTNKKPQYKTLPSDPGDDCQNLQKLSQEWQQYYKQRQDSIVYDMFQGQSVSIIECKQCMNKTATFNSVMWLPVSISSTTNSQPYSYRYPYNQPNTTTPYTISQLLRQQYNTTNELQDYYCNNCQDLKQCLQHVNLFKLPKYLVLQLKRFDQDQYGSRRKVNSKVKVSQFLNLENILHVRSQQLKSDNNKCIYKLNSTVYHFGTVHGGHYTSRVYKQSQQKWYTLNDSIVSQQKLYQPQKQQSSSVYLLFYERVQ